VNEEVSSPGLPERIRDLLRRKGNRILAIKDIHQRLNEEPDSESRFHRDEVERVVERLEREGELLAVRGKRYSLLEFTPFIAGKIRVHPDGFGTLQNRNRDLPDVYIERRALKGAMNGDLVLVRVDTNAPEKVRKGGRVFVDGEVNRILRREHQTVVGRFHDDAEPYVVPFDIRLESEIAILPDQTMDARDGEMVNVEIESYPGKNSIATGRVVETLGFIGEPGVDIEVVIRKFHIPHRFPDEVLAAADAIPMEIPESEIARRVDLRERNIVTIDGETAKDFDDAVEVTMLPNGNYQLGVHIADVSHYVQERSELDKEAFERATSVYFPGRVVPMLPERLSNGLCSLNPRVDRLTFSVSVEIDARGKFHNPKVFRSVIRTKERMTYTNVFAILEEPTPELTARYEYLLEDFQRMYALFKILRQKRQSRGSIDFDLPEGEVLLDEGGDIKSIQATERNVAHRLIEEFMLTANEIVAQHLVFANQPGIFRVHQPPDVQKIEDLKDILKEFKFKLRVDPENIRPGELQRVLNEVTGKPEERFVTEFILRSMKRALYSEENSGHFALALDNYCHFTSPIRRYPDLIVHRRLGELLAEGPAITEKFARLEALHPTLALQSSEREKRAEDASREVMEWKKVIFMRDKVGLEFDGTITGVMPFGLFIELEAFFVQGLVPVASIGGDFWHYLDREHRLRGESTSREFRLGDKVKIEVKEINEDRRQIEFRLVEAGGVRIADREKRGRYR
jgi:ribonuclease R